MNNVGNVGMANIPMVPGPAVGPPMPMMNNGGAVAPPAASRPQQQPINEGNKHLLNTYIYEYFLRNEMYDCARALLASDPQIKVQDGPNTRRDENGNIVANGETMDVDSKDGIDSKGPEGLPQPSIPNPSMDNPFLYEWFCLFWDMFNAQKGKSANNQVQQYINFNQVCSRCPPLADPSKPRLNFRPEPVPHATDSAARNATQYTSGHGLTATDTTNAHAAATGQRHQRGDEKSQQHGSTSHGQQPEQVSLNQIPL